MTTPIAHPRDPLHGITLETILNHLVQKHGWKEMAHRIQIRCFMFNPTIKSSLTFLRKNPWAREKVEGWFIAELPYVAAPQSPASRPVESAKAKLL